MDEAARLVVNLTALGFVALGIATAIEWYRQRGRAQGMLALSLISLAVVAAISRAGSSTLGDIATIVVFLASGYFVLLFRDAFLPLSRRARWAATVLLGISCVVGIASATVLANANQAISTAIALEIILTWAIFTGEPIVRFWVDSGSLPSVQKARMRALSLGFTLLIGIVFVVALGGDAVESPGAIIATQLAALAAVPIIFVSFAPPALLRRIWRMGEETEFRSALQDLLIFSPTRQVLAEKAAGWAKRLLGADGAFVVDPEGVLMACSGIDTSAVDEIMAAQTLHPDGGVERAASWGRGKVIVVPLHLTEGRGCLGVAAGPFTPIFGSDEIIQLESYASAVTAGLERAHVTERMADVERNKTQFLNLASHELRGPLTVVNGYVSMLESGVLGNLNERGRKAAPVMTAKLLEMNALIEQMIEAARLEDGRLMLRPEEADLRGIVDAVVEAARLTVDERHQIELKNADEPVLVQVDAQRVRTILANLISNAIKYSPEGGTVECEVTARAGVARVVVKDSGIGIARQDLPVLFTRFGRISTPQTSHLPGTGLGLYLARQLARLHGGEITVDSTPGHGSTFTFQMPLSTPPPVATDPPPPTPQRSARV